MDSAVLEQDAPSRSQRRRARKRRRFASRLFVVLLVAAVIAGGVTLVAKVRHNAKPKALIGEASDGGQLTLLMAMTLADDPSQQADSLTLFGVDRSGAHPVVLFIPAGTFGQIPGQGFEKIGKALTFGRPTLEQTTVENLLGIGIDRTIVLDDVTLGTIVEQMGGIDVDVQEDLFDTDSQGRKVLAFSRGRQHMDGARALTYMTARGDGVSELDRFVRAKKVWQAIFAEAGPKGAHLASAIASIDATSLDADDAKALTSLLTLLAARDPLFEDAPADAVGSGGDAAYKLDGPQAATLVKRDFAGSVAAGVDPSKRPRLEIRNGNGKPESGERVASLLVPVGMNVVVTGNARSFDFGSTRIVVYGDDDASIALARRVQDLLGVGEIEVGTRGQTVVDVTVVVGRDFAKRRG